MYLFLHIETHAEVEVRLLACTTSHSWTRSNSGFISKIHYDDQAMGMMEVDALAFAQYRESYLNLAFSSGDVCGLVIENARRYEKITEQKNHLTITLEQLKKNSKRKWPEEPHHYSRPWMK